MSHMDIEDSPVEYEQDGHIASVILDRPDSLNAVTPSLYAGVERGLELAEADDARAVILRGKGRAFCVGADLEAHNQQERTQKERREYVWRAQNACEAIQTHPMPVVVQAQGYAIGAGAEMALSGDFILMDSEAEMRFPEASLGTFVGGGVTYTLPQRVGVAKARELLLTGGTVTAQEANDLGLATDIFPKGELASAVKDLAANLAKNAPVSMRLLKKQLRGPMTGGREHHLTAEAEALLACMATEDWKEGVKAFDEDREPEFVGE